MELLSRLLQQIFLPDGPIQPFLKSLNPVLPFAIRVVCSNDELIKVARLRLSVYRVDADVENAIDVEDFSENSVVLAAFDKESEEVIGTMRVAFSSRGKTTMQNLAALPGLWGTLPYGEARLLCVPKSEHSRMVLLMLCKAFFQLCRTEGLDNIIIGSRRAMEPFYRILCFEDVATPPLYFSPPSNSMPHRILGLRVSQLEHIWSMHDNTGNLRHIFFAQKHADIELGGEDRVRNPLAVMKAPVIEGKTIELQSIASLVR